MVNHFVISTFAMENMNNKVQSSKYLMTFTKHTGMVKIHLQYICINDPRIPRLHKAKKLSLTLVLRIV